MKDKIKEINIKIPGQILDYVDTKEHLLELFNYITNLQEENEKLRIMLIDSIETTNKAIEIIDKELQGEDKDVKD